MRTGSGMSEESADLVRSLVRQDVLELAGLLLDFRLAVERKAVSEQAFGKSMPANNVRSALAPPRGEFDYRASIAGGNAGGL